MVVFLCKERTKMITETIPPTDQGTLHMPDNGEVLGEQQFVLQTPEEFRDDFVAAASRATTQVGLEVMQFEVNGNTQPIFDALMLARQNGVDDVRFHYDRVALKHIRTSDIEGEGTSSAYVALGITAMHGGAKNKTAVRQDVTNRARLVRELELQGITDPSNKKRGQHGILSHNHVKIAVADNEAWFGTMNLRGIDFSLSNFMMKVTDPHFVGVIKEVFEQTKSGVLGEDKIYPKYDDAGEIDTMLMLDTGVKGRSVIFEKALTMARSLAPGDQFTFIGQWPPVEGRLGRAVYGDLMDILNAQTRAGVKGKYLMSREEDLHPTQKGTRYLQRKAKEMEAGDPNMTAINLTRSTHAKGFLITRADGSREVLFGSHNLTKWTVRNGTRELAMWSKDPEIVDQFANFIDTVESE